MGGRAVEVCRELLERMLRGDEGAYDLLAEDFVNHAAGPQGRAGFRATVEHVERDLPVLGVEVHHVFGDEEHVCVRRTLRAVHAGSTMPLLRGVPVTGREVSWTSTHVFRVADGLVVEHWATRDDVGLLRQLGAWPPPG